MIAIADTLIQGLMLGGLYGLFAAGLSLVFGVMRLVNVAHGDFIVLAAFLSLAIQQWLGTQSIMLIALMLVPMMFCIGYLVQRLLFNSALDGDMLRPVLITFGLSVILQNVLLQAFSADAQRVQAGALEVASIGIGQGLHIGAFPLLVLVVCVAIIAALQWMLYRTELGRAFRATSDDGVVASMMGVNHKHLFGVATAIAFAVVALAGLLMGVRATFGASSGPEQLIFAFEAVIVGGLGSLWGTLAGGILLGIAQSVGARISPDLQFLAGHLTFLVVLMLRPQGLFPRVQN